MVTWEQARDDWRLLAAVIWAHQGLPPPSRVQQDMLLYMQHGPDRQMITAARGFAKTYLGCVSIIGTLMQDPNAETLVVSKSSDKAKDFTTMIRSWINTVPLLAPLRPKKGWRNQANQFDVGTRTKDSHSASVTAKGITSQITGNRASKILFDDVETLENSATVEQREKLLLKLTEGDSILHPGGRIQYNGTFQSQKSIYLEIARQGAFDIRNWPARYPSLNEADLVKWLAPMLLEDLESGRFEPEDPTFPERYDNDELDKRAASMGLSRFRLQFMNDPSLSDENRYPLKLRDLVVLPCSLDNAPVDVSWAYGMEYVRKDLEMFNVGMRRDCWLKPMRVDELWTGYLEKVMFIDPSGRGKDESAWCVGGSLNGRIFVLRTGASQEGFEDETLLKIAKDSYDTGCHRIRIEPDFGGGMFLKVFTPLLERYYAAQKIKKAIPLVEDAERAQGQKEVRIINILEPVCNQHRLIVNESVVQDKELWQQFTEITHERGCLHHDDRVEALSGMVAYFTRDMDINQDDMKKRLEEEEVWKELMDFEKTRGKTLNITIMNNKRQGWLRIPGRK